MLCIRGAEHQLRVSYSEPHVSPHLKLHLIVILPFDAGLQASVNLATRQAHVVTVVKAGLTPSAAELARIIESTGFPARVLWDTVREDTRVVLDVQGLKVGWR